MAEKRILIVEDEEETLNLLSQKLTKRGFEIIKAMTAADAINQALRWVPDLILMDILLPDGDGSEAVKVLSGESSTQHIPIIFLSGIITRESGKMSQVTVGTRQYHAIPKPFTFRELLQEIDRVLE